MSIPIEIGSAVNYFQFISIRSCIKMLTSPTLYYGKTGMLWMILRAVTPQLKATDVNKCKM